MQDLCKAYEVDWQQLLLAFDCRCLRTVPDWAASSKSVLTASYPKVILGQYHPHTCPFHRGRPDLYGLGEQPYFRVDLIWFLLILAGGVEWNSRFIPSTSTLR